MKILLLILSVAALSESSVIRTIKLERGPAKVRVSAPRSPLEPMSVIIEAFDEEHTLRLVPAPSPFAVDFKLQKAARDSRGRTVIKDVSDNSVVSGLYHDPDTEAVVIMNGTSVEGLITSKLSIKKDETGVHEAIRHPESEASTFNDYLELPAEARQFVAEPSTNTGKDEVNPELFVIVDSTLATALGSNHKIREYLAIFWNAVNKRFATMNDPKVKLVLSGSLISYSSADEPYISSISENYIDGQKTLDSTGDWLYKNKDLIAFYDLAYLMTGKDMADVENDYIKPGLAGIAYKGAACVVDDFQKRSFNTGMGEDMNAYYAGVMTAAHEVAHNLGSPHDGEKGAEACPWDDGFIMSYVTGTSNKLHFSSCSQQLMKNYISSSEALCLHTTQVGETIPQSSQLPGEIVSMDEQCRNAFGNPEAYASTNVTEDSLCMELICEWQIFMGYYVYSYKQTTNRPAAEGSPCRSGGSCMDGLCQ